MKGYGVHRSDLPDLVDDWQGELARKGYRPRTRASYRWTAWKFCDAYPHKQAAEITQEDCERVLNGWTELEPATLAQRTAGLASFTAYLHKRGIVTPDPMERVARPKRKRPEMLDVVSVTSDDVRRMVEHVQTWTEALCLYLAICTGARRGALSSLRWRQVDLAGGLVRFSWKGGGVLELAMSEELRELFVQAVASGQLDTRPDAYVIPNLRPAGVRRAERDDRIVWTIVRRIAARAGLRAHVHALRAAFAVLAHDEGGLDGIDLKEIMGHKRVETVLVYLRRRDQRRSIEKLRGLSWGVPVLSARALEAHTGFEPVLPA